MKRISMPHWPHASAPNLPGTPQTRTRDMLAALGHPEQTLPPVIHVAGTNGKGSVIAYLRAILEDAGYLVHAYTSPHLHRFNERIVLSGRVIDDRDLHQLLEECRQVCDALPHGFFDATTAAALLAFSRTEADILLMETGIGGRHDATNVVSVPLLTILMPISYDHTKKLGSTLAEITRHKCGILRPDVPCIVSYQPPEVLEVIEEEARIIGAPLYIYGRHYAVQKSDTGMIFTDGFGSQPLPPPALEGGHQLVNAATALASISALTEYDIDGEAVVRGLQLASWPGRLERMEHALVKPPHELWYDGGHNESAGYAMAAQARSWEKKDGKTLFLITGTSEGKDASAMLSPIAPYVKLCCGIRVETEPSPQSAADIAQAATNVGIHAVAMDSLEDAVAHCLQQAAHMGVEARILVFGSLFLRAALID